MTRLPVCPRLAWRRRTSRVKGITMANGQAEQQQPGHDLIVIGTSTGGVEALAELTRGLPAGLPAAVCVVMHTSAQGSGLLPRILARHSALPILHATDGEEYRPGRVYVAPPDRHLLIEGERLRVVHGPRENRHRPAVDPLFRSAAQARGPGVIGVILTGALNDGTAGLLAIKRRGGLAIVQDPQEALAPGMPASALRHVEIDYCLPLERIAAALVRLADEPAAEAPLDAPSGDLAYENRIVRADPGAIEGDEQVGQLSALTCPECRGPLWEIRDNGLLRYRCRTGHAFTAETMLSQQSEALEEALWYALNTLQESAIVSERLATQATARGHHYVAERFTDRARQVRQRANVIRHVLSQGEEVLPLDAVGLAGE